MGAGVVAEGEADDAGFGVLHDEDLRELFAALAAGRGGEDFDGRGGGVGVVVVEFVGDFKFRGHAFGDGVFGVGDLHREGAEGVVALGAAADDFLVPIGEVPPRIPGAGVVRDDGAAAVRVVDQGLFRGGADGLVGAEQEHVHAVEDGGDAVEVLGEIDPADDGRERGFVGAAKEFHEVV